MEEEDNNNDVVQSFFMSGFSVKQHASQTHVTF
jgi:hypothetical protein